MINYMKEYRVYKSIPPSFARKSMQIAISLNDPETIKLH
jgi:hypothetical protein